MGRAPEIQSAAPGRNQLNVPANATMAHTAIPPSVTLTISKIDMAQKGDGEEPARVSFCAVA